MALLAGLRKVRRDVIRIGRAPEILQVAGYAGRAIQVVVVVDVAVRALARGHGVCIGQGKSNRRVIELGIQPVIRAVALFASRSKLCCDMVRVGCTLEVRGVAGIAIGRHRLKLAGGRAFVAGIAVHRRMCPGQRKAIVMLLHLLDRNRPSPHCVALLTIRAELPLVNIGVAILATLPHIVEHQLDVALSASHRLVHTAQGIPSLIVIELRNGADRTPGVCRVTVLTGSVEIAVRTVRASVVLRGRRRSRNRREP